MTCLICHEILINCIHTSIPLSYYAPIQWTVKLYCWNNVHGWAPSWWFFVSSKVNHVVFCLIFTYPNDITSKRKLIQQGFVSTHWGLNNMAIIWQKPFSKASWKTILHLIQITLNFVLRFQLMISQYWSKQWFVLDRLPSSEMHICITTP